ncbi:hypothetical protein BP6252_08220 [Coleophoma cylindrospora]|uniref:Uncharacterized protein n=1 Tax=Coleophoma cylindrospora TaxID=1849047 RepID=A0A3D8R5G9_9HELO|nr:hypothetical protein BP6252_08220 [Coleophoma cylindrospora]
MAEQDIHNSHLGGNQTTISQKLSDATKMLTGAFTSKTSGAEQDRHASHFSNGAIPKPDFFNSSGAEQDRHASHLSTGPLQDKVQALDNTASHFSLDAMKYQPISPNGSAAEQDRYAAHLSTGAAPKPDFSNTSGAEQDRYGSHFSTGAIPKPALSHSSGAEQDRYASHFSRGPIPGTT